MLYVPVLKKNLFLVSTLEEKGYVVLFKKGQVLTHSEGASPDTAVSIGVREGKMYRLKSIPVHGSKGILDHGSMSVIENEEQLAPKRVQSSQDSTIGNQPSGGEEESAPSSSIRKPSWYDLTLMDAREHDDALRSTFKESRPPKELWCNISDSKA